MHTRTHTHTHTHAYRCQLCGGRGRTRSRWCRQSLCWSLPSCCGGLSRAGSAQENTRNQNGRTWHRVMVTQMEPRGQMCRLCLVPVPAKKLRRRSSRSSRRQARDGEADLGLTSGVSLSLSLSLPEGDISVSLLPEGADSVGQQLSQRIIAQSLSAKLSCRSRGR